MGWGHHHPRQAHSPLLAVPPATTRTFGGRGTLLATRSRRGSSLPTGRLLLLTLLLLLLLLLLLWCRSCRRRCRGPIRLEVSKLIAAMSCTSLSTTTIILALASATAAESAGSYRIDVGADQIVLPSSSHSRLGFSPVRKPELVLCETDRPVAFWKRSR